MVMPPPPLPPRGRGVRRGVAGTSLRPGVAAPCLLVALLVALIVAPAEAVPPRALAPTAGAGVAGGAGAAELAELSELEAVNDGSTLLGSASEPVVGSGTIREALGGGVVEPEDAPAASNAVPGKVRTGGSRCSSPQECVRVDQCPPGETGVLFECAPSRVCCEPRPPQTFTPAPQDSEDIPYEQPVRVPDPQAVSPHQGQHEQPQQPVNSPQQRPPSHQPAYNPQPVHQERPIHQQSTYNPQPVHQERPLQQQPAYNPQPVHQERPQQPQSSYNPQPVHQERPVQQQPASNPQTVPQHQVRPTPQQPAYIPQPAYQQRPTPQRPASNPPPVQPVNSPQAVPQQRPTPQQPQGQQPVNHPQTEPQQRPTIQPQHSQPPKFTINIEAQTQRPQSQPNDQRVSTKPSKTTGRPPVSTPTSPKPTSPKPTQLLPDTNTCGKVITENRITNGKIANPGQFPWMALLGYNSQANVTFLCGGTLINERYVLTAAHCIRPQNRPVLVRLGEFNLTEAVDCDHYKVCSPPPQDIAVERVIPHPEFNIRNIKHDIALIRLSRSVTEYSEFVRPICLPVGVNVTDEKKFKIAGWGKTDFKDAGGSPVLQFTDVRGVGHDECNELQPPELQPLDPGQLCAGGDKGKDACKGDSGGPLMVTLVSNPPGDLSPTTVTYQIGVVSYGPDSPCGTAPLPSIYTRVATYVPWILSTLRP